MTDSISTSRKIAVFTLTWPIFIETLLRIMIGNADTFMLSRYSGDAVASVGAANQIINVLIMLYWVISTGTTVIASQSLGANKRSEAVKTISTAITGSLIFGLLISLLMLIFAEPILVALRIPNNLMNYSVTYLRIVGAMSFNQALISTISASIRSYGHTQVTMLITIGMNLLNIAGNALFIFGLFGLPVLGVTGVAISTVVSQTIGTIVMFIVLIGSLEERPSFKDFIKIQKDRLMNILRIGVPSGGEGLAYHLSQLVVLSFMSSMGAIALETRQYTILLMLFIMSFAMAVGQGTQIVVGHLIGAGKREEAYRTCLRSLKASILISFSMAIIFSFFSKSLLGIFTDDKNIIELGSSLLFLTIVLEPGRVFNIVIINSLRAAGDVRFPVYMGIISMWGVSVVLSYILGVVYGMGLIGVWIAFACDEWIRGIIMLLRWRSRIWEKMSLIRSEEMDRVPQFE